MPSPIKLPETFDMKTMKTKMICGGLAAVVGGASLTGAGSAPAISSVSRRTLLSVPLASTKTVDRVEIHQITLAPGVHVPVHSHPCPVVGVVTSGSILFQVDGFPIQQLKAGDAFHEPANVRIRHFDNASSEVAATFVPFYLLGGGEHELIHLLPED